MEKFCVGTRYKRAPAHSDNQLFAKYVMVSEAKNLLVYHGQYCFYIYFSPLNLNSLREK